MALIGFIMSLFGRRRNKKWRWMGLFGALFSLWSFRRMSRRMTCRMFHLFTDSFRFIFDDFHTIRTDFSTLHRFSSTFNFWMMYLKCHRHRFWFVVAFQRILFQLIMYPVLGYVCPRTGQIYHLKKKKNLASPFATEIINNWFCHNWIVNCWKLINAMKHYSFYDSFFLLLLCH